MAVKVIETTGDQVPSKIMNELQLMMKLRHPNIVQALHVAMWVRPHAARSRCSTDLSALTGLTGSSLVDCGRCSLAGSQSSYEEAVQQPLALRCSSGSSSGLRGSSKGSSSCYGLRMVTEEGSSSCSNSSSSAFFGIAGAVLDNDNSSSSSRSASFNGSGNSSNRKVMRAPISSSSSSSSFWLNTFEPPGFQGRTMTSGGGEEEGEGDESDGVSAADCKAWIVLEYCEGGTYQEAIMNGLYHDEKGQVDMVSGPADIIWGNRLHRNAVLIIYITSYAHLLCSPPLFISRQQARRAGEWYGTAAQQCSLYCSVPHVSQFPLSSCMCRTNDYLVPIAVELGVSMHSTATSGSAPFLVPVLGQL